jgi:hypothetical protein
MHWFESYVYLAAWLSLLVALVSFFMQNVKANFTGIDWSRSLLYIAFLTCLAVAISPMFDEKARTWAGGLVIALLGFLIVDRKPR